MVILNARLSMILLIINYYDEIHYQFIQIIEILCV